MFFEDEKWIPLADVFENLYAAEALRKPKPIWDAHTNSDEWGSETRDEHVNAVNRRNHDVHADACCDTWGLCDNIVGIGVLLRNGKTVRASKRLLTWVNPMQATGEHVHLHFGTVGSARWVDDQDNPPSEEYLEKLYGGFVNCPVVLNRKEVEAFRKKEKESPSGQIYSERSIADQIIAAFDEDPSLTREEAKRRFAAESSKMSFIHPWARAVEARPALARPGRRRNREA